MQEAFLFDIGACVANRYEIVKTIGAGAMGSVCLARDHALSGTPVVLKILYPQWLRDRAALTRFRNEVVLSRNLSHPNIVDVYSFESTGSGQYFLTMEYVHGCTLKDQIYDLTKRRLTFDRIIAILYEISLGIAHAHENAVVHRDLKPDNILLAEGGRVKVTDFGLARSLNIEHDLTRTGETVGTPYYMAPEQIRGEAVDARCDVYAIGIIAYEMITGERPFVDDSWYELAKKHLLEPIPKIAIQGSGVPQWFQIFIERCTAKDPNDRPANAGELLKILKKHVKGNNRFNSRLSPPSWFRQKRKAAIRRKKNLKIFRRIGISIIAMACVLWGAYQAIEQDKQIRLLAGCALIQIEQSLNVSMTPLKEKLFKTSVSLTKEDLLNSIEKHNRTDVELLLRAGIDPNIHNEEGISALRLAVNEKQSVITRLLLEAGAQIEERDQHGRTPLITASSENNLAVLWELIRAKGNVDAQDIDGLTPLMHTAKIGNSGGAHILIRGKASLEILDNKGYTALIHAAEGGHLAIVDFLLGKGALITPSGRNGVSALAAAARGRHAAIVKSLLNSGAEVNPKALLAAIQGTSPEIIKMLDAALKQSQLHNQMLSGASSLNSKQPNSGSMDVWLENGKSLTQALKQR